MHTLVLGYFPSLAVENRNLLPCGMEVTPYDLVEKERGSIRQFESANLLRECACISPFFAVNAAIVNSAP